MQYPEEEMKFMKVLLARLHNKAIIIHMSFSLISNNFV
jgi:hypothetical protein